MTNNHFRATLAIILASVLWGLSFLSIKIAVTVIPPMTLALIRFSMASCILVAVLKFVEPQTRLKFEDFPLMATAGVIGVTLYFYFENNGVKLTTASTSSIIISTIPVFSLAADAIFFKNHLNIVKILSVVLSIAGVYLVVGNDITSFTSGFGLGYIMMFGAAVAWVIYAIITKPLCKRYSQIAIVTYQTVFGTIAFIPFALFENTPWHLVSLNIMLNIVYLAVFCSALGYFLYVYSLEKLGMSTSSLYINLIPVIAVAASYVILDEKINLNQIIGGVLVILAVSLPYWDKPKMQISEEIIA